MIIIIYITFFFIVLRFVVTLFNFISDPKLRRVSKQYANLVSILIPARNEESQIVTLLNSISEQDYRNYEVIILDDDSSDKTYIVCADFASKNDRFRVVKGKKLSGDWLGKNYACAQLAELAKGEFLLFLDADDQVCDGLINSAVHRMHAKNLALLSLFTNQKMNTIGERLTVPLMHYMLLNMLPLRSIYLFKNPSVAAASGQFMLFDAKVYHANEWHERVKDKVVEDVEIMKQVKLAGYNGEGLLANGLINCRMYHSYSEAINGFGKNFLAAFNYNILSFTVFLFLLIAGPIFVIMTLDLPLIAMMLSLILLSRVMISLETGQNVVLNILLHCLQMCSLVLIAVWAVHNYLAKTTQWKGRTV